MKTLIKTTLLAGLALATAASLQFEAAAQGSLFSIDKSGSSPRKGSQPTVITADSMDIDIANNVATLIGNVEVDDVEMNIKCHKMIIYLESVKSKEGEGEKKEDEMDPEKSKQLRKVECIGDVVITRKMKLADAAGVPQAEQKALAGRADYDVVEGKIVLSEDPVIFRGKDRVKGTRITIYRESERMNIQGGTIETTASSEDKSVKSATTPAKTTTPEDKTSKP